MPVEEALMVNCTNDNAKDAALIRNLFVEHKADGIFASVERYAILTYEVCRSLNLSIPDDVKVIGFSNLQTAALLNPSLSTITQPAFEMGREAVTMLLKALEKKNFQLKNENIVIKSSLTQRESTMLRD
jgi:LacI family transcriptional regulator